MDVMDGDRGVRLEGVEKKEEIVTAWGEREEGVRDDGRHREEEGDSDKLL